MMFKVTEHLIGSDFEHNIDVVSLQSAMTWSARTCDSRSDLEIFNNRNGDIAWRIAGSWSKDNIAKQLGIKNEEEKKELVKELNSIVRDALAKIEFPKFE